MRNRGPRHYRLKVEFLLAIAASFFIASFALYGISNFIENFTDDAQKKLYDKLDQQVKGIADEVEAYIRSRKIGEKNEHLLDEKLSTYKNTEIVVQMFRKDEIEILLEGSYDIWPVFQNHYVVTEQHIFIISIQLDDYEKYSVWISVVYLGSFILLFVIALSYFISRKQRYLRNIGMGLDILEAGRLEYRIPERGNDEITDVARHINKMSLALKNRIEKEKLIEQSKNQLIANISHDLRTPLTSITGYLTLLKDGYDQEGQINPKYLDICLTKSTALNDLIEQLFEYVMLSNRQMALHSVPLNISTYIKQTCYEWASLLEDHGLEFEFHVEDCNEPYPIDPDKLNRVMENLFKNICKYANPDKKIELVAYTNQDKYSMELSNGLKEGAVISDDDIFNRFFTSDRTMESAGIGLAICKEIITMHHGDIRVHVDQEQFAITIDLNRH